MDYVGSTPRLPFQRIGEHKHSTIGAHNQRNKYLREQFTILKESRGQFEYSLSKKRNLDWTLSLTPIKRNYLVLN